MNFFHPEDLGNHLLQLCPKVVKHPVYVSRYEKLLPEDAAIIAETCRRKNDN
jgi:hypothetical protein